ncbi:apoptosis-associated speck-like protein containing a CARD [Mauremys reevesii]|uniref:apoptosis-associated speck-like protein containing a CARD n=1 Tax=Mauremys reevesii TaxID=260615 RepID=UPI00193F40DA|nr:apoptosis-associated speck-like protein containing a CARD [Mauremys reevesii]
MSARDRLENVLEELEEMDFKKFKVKLNQAQPPSGYSNIPRGQLERADCLDVCRLMISYYLETGAIQMAKQVLEDINQRDLAAKLEGV